VIPRESLGGRVDSVWPPSYTWQWRLLHGFLKGIQRPLEAGTVMERKEKFGVSCYCFCWQSLKINVLPTADAVQSKLD
jgi:hypothetical protein